MNKTNILGAAGVLILLGQALNHVVDGHPMIAMIPIFFAGCIIGALIMENKSNLNS